MREIKFRAWDKIKKKMVDVKTIEFGSNKEILLINEYATDRFILMQYTGLKDKNGKEIYEGDLIIREGQKKPVEVVWKGQGWYPIIDSTAKVVGNKYEGIKNKN